MGDSGCVCHAVRAPGSKVTIAPLTRAESLPLKGESTRTVPVKYPAGPLLDGCDPLLLISIKYFNFVESVVFGCSPSVQQANCHSFHSVISSY
jgi:hypothetical protein